MWKGPAELEADRSGGGEWHISHGKCTRNKHMEKSRSSTGGLNYM